MTVICAQCRYHAYGDFARICTHPRATSISEITGDSLYRTCYFMREQNRPCGSGQLFEKEPAPWWRRLFRRAP